MQQKLLNNLTGYRIILASNSPRRKQLLKEADVDFDVFVIDDIDESYPQDISVKDIPVYLSTKKSNAYNHLLENEKSVIITADTIVVLNNKVIGKPVSEDDAVNILKTLSGKMHKVITGVTVKSLHKTISFSSETKVWFKNLSENEINYYIKNHNPFDKAGAYGIQEWIGHIGIKKVEGSYFNVVGLPIQQLYDALTSF